MAIAGLFTVPLSMVSSLVFAMPYIIAIIAIFIAILVLFVRYPSLRNYRRKRIILIYCVFILVLGLLMFQMDNVYRRAFVNYSISTSYDKAYVGVVNRVVWSCGCFGGRSASFYLVISSINASFTLHYQRDYVLISNTTVKVPFSLSESSDSEPVFFIIDDNVTSFSFSASLENRGWGGLEVSSALSSVTFVWNATENYYELNYASGFTV